MICGRQERGRQIAGPGMDGVPVARVAGGHVAQDGEETEREPHLLRVESAPEHLASDGREPRKLREFLLQLLPRPDKFLSSA
jgi:hypothetical protein